VVEEAMQDKPRPELAPRKLLADPRGGTEFIEKLILIGLFAFVVFLGIRYIAGSVNNKLTDQGDTVETIPGGPPTGGP
jgi:hypothetical protein